jgi:hypothetical protein
VRADDEAVLSVDWPLTVRVDAVVEASVVAPEVVNPVVEALPNVVCPVTCRVPLETRDEVAVIVPPVRVLMTPVMAERREEKKPFEVVELVMFALVLVREATVNAVADALFNTVCPLTVRLVDDAFPRVEVPAVSVLTVPVVAVKVVIVALVVVELPTMRLVMLANVATSDEMKELVEVLLVA